MDIPNLELYFLRCIHVDVFRRAATDSFRENGRDSYRQPFLFGFCFSDGNSDAMIYCRDSCLTLNDG